jgi:N6-L-threonylcarbamoyladenine synthase
MTYGYLTKNTRIRNELPKEHRVDALCISGNPQAKRSDWWYYIKKVRNQNRQLHKNTILKGGYRKANKAERCVFGYQLFDKVKYNNQEGFIFGRRSSGYFDVRKLDGTKLSASVSYKKLELLNKAKGYILERRATFLPVAKARGFLSQMS